MRFIMRLKQSQSRFQVSVNFYNIRRRIEGTELKGSTFIDELKWAKHTETQILFTKV